MVNVQLASKWTKFQLYNFSFLRAACFCPARNLVGASFDTRRVGVFPDNEEDDQRGC